MNDVVAESVERTRYGAGLPRIGERRLAAHEVRSVRRAIRTAIAQTGLMATTLLVATGVVIAVRGAPPDGLVAALGGPAGVGVFVVGFMGAFGAVVAGRRYWKWSAALGLLYMMAIAGAAAVDPKNTGLATSYLTWAVALSTVVIGIGFGVSRLTVHGRVLVRVRRVRADLTAGVVEQFEGPLRPAAVDRAISRVLRGPAKDGYAGGPHRVEMLPTSGVVVRVDGRIPVDLDVAHLVDVASARPHAFRAPLPDGLATPQGAKVTLARRSLSAAERIELETHIRRLRHRSWQVGTVAVATVAAMAWQFQTSGGWVGLLTGPCLAWYGLCLFTWVGYARRVRAAGRLESDRDLRWVVTVDNTGELNGDLAPPKLEVLPISQLAWTEDAAPATWRTVRL